MEPWEYHGKYVGILYIMGHKYMDLYLDNLWILYFYIHGINIWDINIMGNIYCNGTSIWEYHGKSILWDIYIYIMDIDNYIEI
jgi:hypothetical protein